MALIGGRFQRLLLPLSVLALVSLLSYVSRVLRTIRFCYCCIYCHCCIILLKLGATWQVPSNRSPWAAVNKIHSTNVSGSRPCIRQVQWFSNLSRCCHWKVFCSGIQVRISFNWWKTVAIGISIQDTPCKCSKIPREKIAAPLFTYGSCKWSKRSES